MTSSIIKTRSQSRTGTTPRTGTNVRTNDDTIAPAPAPVAVATTERTIDLVDPVVVTTTDPAPVDLFAGRPTTGALKDPPAPRDDAKKPAAKPKGRPKKVAPKATTRKPRNSRAPVDPNELVDPMSRVHVGDAGGLARAGGHDPVLAVPVLANPEQDPEPLDEPQPKKTCRAVDRRSRASRAHRAGHGNDDDDEDSYSTVGTGTGGYGNGGNGGGDDDDYDDFDPDADSIVDSQGVPEAPGA